MKKWNITVVNVKLLRKRKKTYYLYVVYDTIEIYEIHYYRSPENVPRLFDLIRVQDERIRPAFYYAVRETLVANNLDQATRIAYGAVRYRVVTLGGELIEISGMTSIK